MKRAHAYRLIESAGVMDNLSPIGDKPATESQARPLSKLPPEKQPEAWQAAIGRPKKRSPCATVSGKLAIC